MNPGPGCGVQKGLGLFQLALDATLDKVLVSLLAFCLCLDVTTIIKKRNTTQKNTRCLGVEHMSA